MGGGREGPCMVGEERTIHGSRQAGRSWWAGQVVGNGGSSSSCLSLPSNWEGRVRSGKVVAQEGSGPFHLQAGSVGLSLSPLVMSHGPVPPPLPREGDRQAGPQESR